MATQGTTAAIAFGTSSFTASIVRIGGSTNTREVLDDTDLTSGTFKTSQPGKKVKPGPQTFDFWYDADDQPPITGVVETVTITYPIMTPGNTTNATKAGTAYISEWTEPDLENDGLQRATATIEWSGGTGPTYTDESA